MAHHHIFEIHVLRCRVVAGTASCVTFLPIHGLAPSNPRTWTHTIYTYKEKLALDKQKRLIEELEAEDRAEQERLARQEAAKEKKREKRQRQK